MYDIHEDAKAGGRKVNKKTHAQHFGEISGMKMKANLMFVSSLQENKKITIFPTPLGYVAVFELKNQGATECG